MTQEFERLIENLNSSLTEAYRDDSALFEDLKRIQSELGLLYDDRPTCPFLRPHFIKRELYDSIAAAAESIAEAAELVTKEALEDQTLLDVFDLTDEERELVRLDPGYTVTSLSSRFDTFVDGDQFRFLEYNAETPAGVGDQTPLEAVLNRIPLIKDFLNTHKHWLPAPHKKLLIALFESYRESGGTKPKPNIAIVDWEGVSTEAEFYILKDYFESMGFRTLVADPSELEYDGETLAAGSFEIDIIYKRVLIHEFLEKFGLDHPIVDAYRDGNVCLANSFRCKIPHKKALFAIFSDERYSSIFTSEQIDLFRKHIPWTRKVEPSQTILNDTEIDLIEHLRENKSGFVLKPNDDYGGQGVVLGWETDQSVWEQTLKAAQESSFVVQERAPIKKEVFPVFGKTVELVEMLVDFDPFLFRNKVEGGMVRLSTDSLVNVTQGGGQTALVVIDRLRIQNSEF